MSDLAELSNPLARPGLHDLTIRGYDDVSLRVHERDQLRPKEDW